MGMLESPSMVTPEGVMVTMPDPAFWISIQHPGESAVNVVCGTVIAVAEAAENDSSLPQSAGTTA
jgi:secreted PhoX family phosphatase